MSSAAAADGPVAPGGSEPGARRGGAQHIPRPPDVRPGGPPPWAELSEAEHQVSVAQVRSRFAELGPAVRSPREGHVDRASAVLDRLTRDEIRA